MSALRGVRLWLKTNLFSTWGNGLLTLLVAWLLWEALRRSLTWVFTGAEWQVIPANLHLFLVGTYPSDQIWRPWACLLLVTLLAGASAIVWRRAGQRAKAWRRVLVISWVVSFPVVLLLLGGVRGSGFLPFVTTNRWGGFMLTLMLAVVGIALSLPIGVILALGRRSKLPAMRWVSTAYIELVRGIPLISVLFMAQIMVPIFLPEFRIDKVLRAVIGLTLFTAAYMAENVRGGLQGVPHGQFEAAAALGLNGWQRTLLIILPQALRSVIPPIVGQFITLFKDTSLVTIVGLLELMGIARSIVANPEWLGRHAEAFLFAGLIYWLFSYAMSYFSRRLERSLGVGER